ncbi:MAG: sigma-54-dependent Fis family transcriptional regulator [Deltaproteobacteria bacterium]|nr:sigma-54-dependent Fis family transcriptional regulator [Deltaproteobacteria bacterium]MBW1833308.1 sigma-54-dependent Fis family transcriptional regulator [Deltaproteobacteria bacterium]MBW2164637.1 sigma-54-dependent Fis family transcriptional regulator [Deltaproteobacteria bacterium]
MKIQDINRQSARMKQIYNMILNLAPTDTSVVIQGEEGTEKALVARCIHLNSSRKDKPFDVYNCSAYPRFIVESGLFGHEAGAFEGAVSQKKGCLEQNNGGTVFLSEIDKMSPLTQIKLQNFLQDGSIKRLGGKKSISTDVRIIAAVNTDLGKEVEIGTFNEEFSYMLNVINIHLPSLRQRKDDIPLLTECFLDMLNVEIGKNVKSVTSDTMQILMDYSWPGNVKELENSIQHAFLLTEGEKIERKLLPSRILHEVLTEKNEGITSFEENEKRFLMKILQENNWNKLKVAKQLNVSRSTLYSKLNKYNLTVN